MSRAAAAEEQREGSGGGAALGTVATEAKDADSFDISAQLKASFKKNGDGTESLALTGRAPAGISVIRARGKKEARQGD
ncbi:MAG: hypothetical protein HON23_04600 [Rickettsiales bacterium]|jgi:hypothetical protein|nr:hypothetical protein [Rickettsiales bacterium]